MKIVMFCLFAVLLAPHAHAKIYLYGGPTYTIQRDFSEITEKNGEAYFNYTINFVDGNLNQLCIFNINNLREKYQTTVEDLRRAAASEHLGVYFSKHDNSPRSCQLQTFTVRATEEFPRNFLTTD